jgi:hypothetical protein
LAQGKGQATTVATTPIGMYQAIKSLSYLSCTPKIPICSMDETKIPSIYASREDPESESRMSRDSILLFFLSRQEDEKKVKRYITLQKLT